MAKKCEKCGKTGEYLTPVLMMGSRGFRRYPVCEPCRAKIETPLAFCHPPISKTEMGGEKRMA